MLINDKIILDSPLRVRKSLKQQNESSALAVKVYFMMYCSGSAQGCYILKYLLVMQYKKLYKQTKMGICWPRANKTTLDSKGPWRSLVVEHITVAHIFSQLFEVEPKHCVVKMGITCQDLTNHRISQNRDTGAILIGYIKQQLDASQNQRSRFSVFLGAFGIQGKQVLAYCRKIIFIYSRKVRNVSKS